MKVLHRGEFLELRREGHWEYVRRAKASGSVHILAVTDAQELLLVQQYRVPVGQDTIELPAGVIGDEAEFAEESVLECARRELLEETGYQASQVELIQRSPTAPGMSSEIQHLVRATGLVRMGEGGGVAGENITVHRVDLRSVGQWLEQQQGGGLLLDHRVHAALYWCEKKPTDHSHKA